jgi:hypothetical protein
VITAFVIQHLARRYFAMDKTPGKDVRTDLAHVRIESTVAIVAVEAASCSASPNPTLAASIYLSPEPLLNGFGGAVEATGDRISNWHGITSMGERATWPPLRKTPAQ